MTDTTMLECHSGLCLSVYVITFLTGFPANALALYTFSRKLRQKATPIDILFLNLTISDLLFLLFLPFKMHEVFNNMTWSLPYFLCPLSGFVFYMTIYSSILFLTAVSVERYLGVAFPIQHSLRRRPRYAVAASIFFWVMCVLHCSIVFIVPYYNPAGYNHQYNTSLNSSSNLLTSNLPRNVCYNAFTPAQLDILLPVRLEIFVVLFFIPLLICSFCYINFIRILSKLPHISRRRRLRAIGLALGTLVVFALCFGPYNLSHVVGFITKQSPDWRDMAVLLSTFNASLDPFIFYLSSSAVRGTICSMMEGLTSRLSRCLPCNRCWPSRRSTNQSLGDKGPKQGEINGI